MKQLVNRNSLWHRLSQSISTCDFCWSLANFLYMETTRYSTFTAICHPSKYASFH
jgi:hypothetical protein